MIISVARILSLSFVFCLLAFPNSSTAQNSINGMVFDHNRKPVVNIHVELLDDLERLIGSRQTRGSGFYSFQGLNRGVYYLKVRVGGTGFKEKKVRIDLGALNAIGGVDVKQVDLFLELDTRKSAGETSGNGVIFAQNVPADAKTHYEAALGSLKDSDAKKAVSELQNAISVFPEYYDALIELGTIYLSRNEFKRAEEVLEQTVKVNPRSFSGYFGLGAAQSRLKNWKDASVNLIRATEIDPGSFGANLLLGIVQRDLRNYNDAEKSLLKAKQLSDNRSSDANWNLALLYYHNLNKHKEAAEELGFYLKNLSKEDLEKNAGKVTVVKKLIKQIRSEKS